MNRQSQSDAQGIKDIIPKRHWQVAASHVWENSGERVSVYHLRPIPENGSTMIQNF